MKVGRGSGNNVEVGAPLGPREDGMAEMIRYYLRAALVLSLMGFGAACAGNTTAPSATGKAALLENETDDDEDGEVDESDEAAEDGDEDIDEQEADDDQDGNVDEADEGNDD